MRAKTLVDIRDRVYTRGERDERLDAFFFFPKSNGPPPVGSALGRTPARLSLLPLFDKELLQPRQPGERLPPRLLLHPVMEEHALEVVVLVQEDAPRPAAEHGLELGAVEALCLDLDDCRPLFFLCFFCRFVSGMFSVREKDFGSSA